MIQLEPMSSLSVVAMPGSLPPMLQQNEEEM